MNLQQYYQKIRACEEELSAPEVWVVSVDTPDGGRAGAINEVPRRAAAKMIVDGLARAAESQEIEEELARRAGRGAGIVPTLGGRIALDTARAKKPAFSAR